jgi:hypothetical protein
MFKAIEGQKGLGSSNGHAIEGSQGFVDPTNRLGPPPLSDPPCLPLIIEDSPRQATGNLHRKEHDSFYIRSLTPPQAAGNALP